LAKVARIIIDWRRRGVDWRRRGGRVNWRGALPKSSGTRTFLPTGQLTAFDGQFGPAPPQQYTSNESGKWEVYVRGFRPHARRPCYGNSSAGRHLLVPLACELRNFQRRDEEIKGHKHQDGGNQNSGDSKRLLQNRLWLQCAQSNALCDGIHYLFPPGSHLTVVAGVRGPAVRTVRGTLPNTFTWCPLSLKASAQCPGRPLSGNVLPEALVDVWRCGTPG
jgi:hypothetical protein